MKCNKHSTPDDDTNSIGVCSSCLRDRLFAILSAQQQQSNNKSETKQPVIIPFQFPQSVSPYMSRQNTHTQPFHYTPQVGPNKNSNKGGWKLTSILMSLLGSNKKKHTKPDSDPTEDWKQTPKRNQRSNNLSVFCLSPLVRPGPNRRQATMMPSFCRNRSRKLADIGKCNFNYNNSNY